MEYVKNKARYSRADLLALRYEASAQQRPNCANKLELQTLNFWKIIGLPTSANVNSSSNNTCYVNKSGISPDRDRESINLTSSTNVLSSRRALRNRERAHNYYQRFSSSEQQIEDSQGQSQISLIPGSVSSNISSYKTTAHIDQRSISSSHLMPAFAKRRFVTVSGGGACNEASNESQQVKVNASLMIYTDRSLNPKDANADIKAQLRHHNNSLGSGSPVEWERTEKQSNSQRCHDKSLTLSPTFQSLRQQGTGISTQERRIGSGRLLPRNDNWEFKNQETDASKSNLDNDQVQNGSISSQHRAFSCKANDKSNDNISDRDRRREDSKKNAVSTRRVFNKDKFNFMESANQSINRGRRGTNNLYHQSHDAYEPEWFSAGPTSQHETIDLHGFEDIESEERPSKTDAALKDPNETSNKQIVIETTATIGSRSSSVGSLIQIESSNYDIMDSNATAVLGDPQNKHHNQICKADEFNFDAFLSMDPMDHSLMRKEGEVHRQITETSRFSRWFSPNEPASNNEITLSSTLETQEIPSVKDLEAQMKKVDLRAEYLNVNSLTNSLKPIHTTEHSDDKSLPRDTEAFKRLLQQLGSQTSGHPVADSYLINVAAVRGGPIANAQDLYKPIAQIKKDEILSYQQQRIVKNDSNSPHGHNNDSMQLPQNLLQTQVMPSPLDAILPGPEHGSLPLQTQKRVDVQHLLQSVIRGDVSFEFLEKELNNPNTTAQSREMIATVLFEYTNSGRFVAQQKSLNLHNDASPTNVVKNYPLLNRNHGALVSEDLFANISNQVTNQHQQPLRHSSSPTPLAFTPTSVLRKMTADKETTSLYSNNNNAINYQQQQYHQNYHQLPTSFTKCSNVHNMMNDSSVITAGINLQPRMILGGNYAIQNQNQLNNPQVSPKILPQQMSQSRGQQTSKWPPASKSYGRPILKGNMNSALTVSSFNNMQQQINQQRLKSMQQTDAINSESVQGSGPSPQQNIHNDGISQQIQHQHYLQQQQQQQSRLRLMHGDLHCPTNIPIKPSASIIGGGTDDKILMNNRLSPLNYHRDDHLSPTANQLSQWFSPELLARASAGKLPLLNMNQALSLEEFERNIQHSSATVLN
ncbi:eukaryotic translation initiation factor 4E transporter [Drosophila nasuta]|uniref:eukaryotic translation initiation factor 4E transporter n=1 Tax=Drosophila nasuta TaxID=42062 RepID=UPI00295F14BD|nr:eukaryotic translation initiation factor 4E transporter [Drosophila nasuta]XP_060661054.1 eukaryotic translation initiation factor 4E transporter [Drosophila nasuta]XP_060661055.1 eukaryotic translation initiation factor 4E transporter [Drosophila nasuta]